jgi:TPR repeat protein
MAGLSYAGGRGVARDESKAVQWWQAAAAQGDADAQLNLGVCGCCLLFGLKYWLLITLC